MAVVEKMCRGCGIVKPLAHYYRHPGMKDGHLNKCRPCVRARVAKHREANIDALRAYDRKRGFRVYDPEKVKARNAVHAHKLTRGTCEVCGTDERVEAHHDDYAKPLDVRWLCKTHHAEHHRQGV